MTVLIIIIAALLAIVILPGISIFNKLVKASNEVDKAFSSVDVMLKKRYDLIPNLVSTVKAYMKHEKEVLTELTTLRTKFLSTNLPQQDKIDIENNLLRSMKALMVAVENYPDLKASQNFIQLQAAWNEAEGQIAAARRFFNSAVTEYNNKIEIFPNNLIAAMMNYKLKKVFEIPDTERQNLDADQLLSN